MKQKILLFVILCLLLLLALAEIQTASAQGPTPLGAQVGKPWRGAPGVTETVAQIMARDLRAPKSAAQPRVIRPRRTLKNIPRQINPSLNPHPALSLQAPALSRSLLAPKSPQPVGTSFLGAEVSESSLVPPDSMGAVGPTQILVAVNGRIKVFDKGGSLGSLNASLDNFFGSLTPGGIGTGDPNARYDRLSERWFVTAIDFDAPERIFIAVSSSSTITDTSSFNFFQFIHDQVGGTPNPDTGKDADYDSLGIDQNSLYVGVNVFGASDLSETGFVINKSDILTGTLTVTAFRALGICNPTCSNGPFSPRGVQNDDPTATEGYFIGMDINPAATDLLTLRRITYSGITPTISSNIFVSLPSAYYPMFGVPAQGSSNPLDDLDNRLFVAQIHKNKITGVNSLWTAHNIRVDPSGFSSSSGDRDASRWYEIRNLTATPTIYQHGTLFDSALSNPRFFWIPSVAMSGQGHMALGASFASVNDYAGIVVAGRLSSDTLGATQPFTIAQPGAGSYNIGVEPSCGCYRWGDYSQTVVDPNDDMTMWTFQEYANATNSWGVQVIQLKAPPPALPLFASPASVALGQSSVDVVITGTSVSGSGFFDPGLGFANHITATVSTGVIVNSVTFDAPTQITLNISTVSASNGAADVIVTNPDGQASTGYCLFIVGNPSPAPSCRLSLPLILK